MISAGSRLWAGSLVRRHWKATVLLAVFAGVAAGAVMTTLTFARQADTVADRRLAHHQFADGSLQSCPPGVDPASDLTTCFVYDSNRLVYDVLRSLPDVVATSLGVSMQMRVNRIGEPASEEVVFGGSVVDRQGLIGAPHVVAGRLPDPAADDETVIGELASRALRVGVGDRIEIQPCTFDLSGNAEHCDAATTARIVGVLRGETDLRPRRRTVPGAIGDQLRFGVQPGVGWWERYAKANGGYVETLFRLRPGADLDGLRAQLEERLPGWTFLVSRAEDVSAFAGLKTSTQLQADATYIVALVLLVAGSAFVGQSVVREVRRELDERRSLVALGMGTRDVVTAATVRAVPLAAGAVLVAEAVTLVAAGWGPPGLAGRAEFDPAVHVDARVMILGAVITFLLLMAFAVGPAVTSTDPLRRHRPDAPRQFTPRFGGVMARAGSLLGAARKGGRALRAAGAGLALAVATIVAAALLVGSLDRVEAHPREFGATWDYGLGGSIDSEAAMNEAASLAGGDGLIAGAAVITTTGPVELPGLEPLWITTFDTLKGDLGPRIVDGRAPEADDEVAVGPATLRKMGKAIGDTIERLPVLVSDGDATSAGEVGPFRIVGTVLVSDDGILFGPGEGLLVTFATRMIIDSAPSPLMVVTMAPGVGQRQAVDHLTTQFGGAPTIPSPQIDLLNLDAVSATPEVVAIIVASLAAGAFAHGMSIAVRRGRRDVAVLRALGLTRGQVVGSVAWRASVGGIGAAVVGVAVGVVGGRLAWQRLADDVGLVSGPVVPVGAVVLAAVGCLAVVNLIAVAPGIAMARDVVADGLRAE